MRSPSLRPGDHCICIDDAWHAIRSLAVESIINDEATVRLAGTFGYPADTHTIAIDRLIYNPFRNAAARASSGRQETAIEAEQLRAAVLVRVAAANAARDGEPIKIVELKATLIALLPELTPNFIDHCLRSMTASGALGVEPVSRVTTASNVKVRASKDLRRSEQVSGFAFSFAEELLSQSRRIGQLVVHRGTAGDYREELLRALLRKSLADRYHVATGFIEGCDLQLDVIVYDRIEYAPLFREGDLVVVPQDSVRAVIEVKTRLTTKTLKEALRHLDSLLFEIEAPIFKGVFAFESDIPDNKLLGHIAKFYESTDCLWGQPYDEVSAICVLNRQLVLSGYQGNPVRPVLSLLSNILGRNFQAAGFLDAMQNYLRSPAPRVFPPGLSPRELIELNASTRDYLVGAWQVIKEDDESGAHERADERIRRTVSWLAGERPW